MSELTFSLFALPLGFLATFSLTFMILKVGARRGLMDFPNERSSHSTPVPRGGGLSIIISFFVFLYAYASIVDTPIVTSYGASLVLGGAIVVLVGFLDDLSHIRARWRFLAHSIAAILALSLLPSVPELMIFGANVTFGTFGYVFLAISLVWFINLFNFMDGIDGIAGVEAITVLGSAALILLLQHQGAWLTLLSFLALCVAGFLVWNWAPARVFMGDACSGFLGFMLGTLAIATSMGGNMNLWVWLILCGVFVVDATTTLVWRVVRGEKWYEAHRSHAYQKLATRCGSHEKVSIGVLFINTIWLLPFAFLAAIFPYWGFLICCMALLPLLMLAVWVGAWPSDAKNLGRAEYSPEN